MVNNDRPSKLDNYYRIVDYINSIGFTSTGTGIIWTNKLNPTQKVNITFNVEGSATITLNNDK